MKKHISLLALLVITICQLFAEPIDTTLAKRVATRFYLSRVATSTIREQDIAIAHVESVRPASARSSISAYYIYNIGNGFVIVSADDRVEPILGYSTEGNFNMEDIPETMHEWLNNYTRAIEQIISNPEITNQETARKWRAIISANPIGIQRNTPTVGPLLTTIWGQSPYFNALCPSNNSGQAVTGCVATAMGQVIRYWRYPTHGIGSHSYVHNDYGTLSADFANTTYNYDNMPNTLTANSSPAQINEIATLLYHCGVSVDMDYGLSSGAVTSYAATALHRYFAYPTCTYKTSRTSAMPNG